MSEQATDARAAGPTLEVAATEFIDLEYEKRALTEQLKRVEEKQAEAKRSLLTKFQEGDMSSFTARGLTVYLHRQTWAGLIEGKDKAAGCEALKVAGLGDLVSEGYNSQSVSARLREFGEDDNGKPALPPELAGTWKMNEVFDVRARKA